jgi:mono/diheme cytochrome c family protein
MDDQLRGDPQEPSELFPDGRVTRAPEPGTVVAGSYAEDEHRSTGKVGGEWATTLPTGMALDGKLLARGRERYAIYCTPCHDAAGTGQGSAVARGMLQPPTLHDDRLRAQGVGYFYDVVKNGIRNMPAYGAQVPVDDRWAIAAWVRVLQRSRMAGASDVPADVAASKGWTQ